MLLTQPIRQLLASIREKKISVVQVAEEVIARATALRDSRAFLAFDPNQVRAQAARLDHLGPPRDSRLRPLHGLPISVKDLFDLRGLPTTCGSSFYAATRPSPTRDSSYIARWRALGVLLVGKTHLNEFAYGITGENLHFGACLQPRDLRLLTGGSSSGAAASVQGGAASIGLGTDTGGSLRVPAAQCGLVAFRQSTWGRVSPGMFPLAPSFDSTGWLQSDLGDLPLVYQALQGVLPPAASRPWRVAFLSGSWLEGCEPAILKAYAALQERFTKIGGLVILNHPADFASAPEIFSPLQACEAARIHRSFLKKQAADYEPAVRSRLEWGASIAPAQYARLQRDRIQFCRQFSALWEQADFLVAPASPFAELPADDDFNARRRTILQLTTPFSLAGLPALVLPWGQGTRPLGWQILARRGGDAQLVQLSTLLAKELAG